MMGATAAARARCSRFCAASTSPTRRGRGDRAPITPILELGVGWNPELDAIDNIYLIGTLMGLSLTELRRTSTRSWRSLSCSRSRGCT